MVRVLRIVARGQRSVLRFSYSAANAALTQDTDVFGSYIQRRGRSNSASVPSEVPSPQKGRKRISKDERKAMLESYVNHYREENAGKFPPVTDAQKHVGGGYYVVRKIIQELEYRSKLPRSSRETERPSRNKLSIQKGAPIEVENDTSQVSETAGHEADDQLEFVVAESEGLKAEVKDVSHPNRGKLGNSEKVKVESDHRNFVTESHTVKMEVNEVPIDVHPGEDVVKRPSVEDSSDSGASEYQEKRHRAAKADEVEKRSADADVSRKTSLWGNLKSFADDLISFWKKQ